MRARLALHASGIAYQLHEVDLRNKPAAMLAASPKGSVPVLVSTDGNVIDESWQIMQWALRAHDPENWLGTDEACLRSAAPLILSNDGDFKHHLDRYKYAGRNPEQSGLTDRLDGEIFLRQLEARLLATRYLLGNTLSIADAAIFPFIRQFAAVDQS